MKTFITNEDFNRVLELLGLPGETLSIEIGMRTRWPFAGVGSSWAMRAVIGVPSRGFGPDGEMLHPYSENVVYVPVLLPGDVPPAQAWPDTVETLDVLDRISALEEGPVETEVTIVTDQNGKIVSVAPTDWRDVVLEKLPDVERRLGVEPCAPVACPPFEETSLEVLTCPGCGSPRLKWQPGEEIDCVDDFHDYGL